MEYRGVQFTLLMTIPQGWRWSFQLGTLSRTGADYNRINAITKAHKAIDAALQDRPPKIEA